MDFIECEKVYSSFKDDQFYLQKKGFCKIDIDNDQDICYLKLVFQKEPTYFNENIEYKLSNFKVNYKNK